MDENVHKHVKQYLESKGYKAGDDEIIECIRDSVVWSGDFDEHRHWTTCFSVSNINGMLIGFENAHSDGDISAEEKGWEFDPESICEAEAHEITTTVYSRKKTERR